MRDTDHVPNVSSKEANAELEKTIESGVTIPKEHADDMMVFPNNPHFRSQNVLSEDLRDEIWRRVREEGKSVREVSSTLGVEMRRVGAVVRLKAVEEGWKREVSFGAFLLKADSSTLRWPRIPSRRAHGQR